MKQIIFYCSLLSPLLFLLHCNSLTAMKRPRQEYEDFASIVSMKKPKSEHNPLNTIEKPNNTIVAEKCPRLEHLQIRSNNLIDSPQKKRKVQPNTSVTILDTTKAMKCPRPEFAQLAVAQHVVQKPVTIQSEDVKILEVSKENTCEKCNKSFVRKYDLTIHVNTSHSDKRPYSCDEPECNANFKSKSILNQHKRHVHSQARPYSCNQCKNKNFKCQGALDAHIAGCHSKIRYTCSICSEIFKRDSSLAKHKKAVHATARPYLCNYNECGKNFKTKEELHVHSKRHSDKKPHICEFPECGKSFVTKPELVEHNSSHSDEKLYECEQCGKYFTFKRSVIRHQKDSCPGKTKKS